MIGHRSATNKIKIIKQLSFNEMIEHFISNQLKLGNGTDELINEIIDNKNSNYHKIIIIFDGDKFTFKNNILHSFDDQPAIQRKYGIFYINNNHLLLHTYLDYNIMNTSNQYNVNIWYTNGNIHRDNLSEPAYIDCQKNIWYVDGQIHRDNDLPAMVYHDYKMIWYNNGKIHRNNDLPAIEYIWGDKEWYLDGKQYDNNNLMFNINMLHDCLEPLQQICDLMTPIVINLKEFVDDEELKTTKNKTYIMSKCTHWILFATTAHNTEEECTDELFHIKCSFTNNQIIITQTIGDIERGSFLPAKFLDTIKSILSQYVIKIK